MMKAYKKHLFAIGVAIPVALCCVSCDMWSGAINLMLPADTRPSEITFAVESLTCEQFDQTAEILQTEFPNQFGHIDRFRDAGILSYEGPSTCLSCHETLAYTDAVSGEAKTVDLMDNLTTSSHYRFFSKKHPNVYGFNGELADDFAMGKLNRPCPKPGSFAMTAWASLVELDDGTVLSEGCGQCHIGGQYAAPLGEIMPGYVTLEEEKSAIDCMICHAVAYDMNRKQVVVDDNDRARWDQDRSMKAAMSVTRPTAQACLRCHQHNMAGDIYVDETEPLVASLSSYHESLIDAGKERPRVKHPGSKRGTPFSPTWDVHAAAGMDCIDCHTTEGHYIAKGTHTTTMMANDLPAVEVSCEGCHTETPHEDDAELADFRNSHVERLACQTCHIPSLHEDNATYRDFDNPVFEEHPGIWVYDDIEKETEPGKGIVYVWWNGDATFLGNPIGDNPNGLDLYSFYKPNHVWPEYEDYDYAGWYEQTMRPIARNGRPSKLYAMKRFNGKQHIDLQNMGPFGGMFLPYNLPTYYTSGSADSAVVIEMQHSMMDRMYGWMFKVYMMDKFMSFMDVDGWNTGAYDDAAHVRKVEARWIPMDASLEISHAIRREGALTCNRCHSENSILDFDGLGYPQDEIAKLQTTRP